MDHRLENFTQSNAMPASAFLDELAVYGPEGSAARPSLDEASAYCRRLAQTHYENFSVASRLLPPSLRPHFHHVYAYCRWADDLADETGDAERSLRLLDWWEQQLRACYRGEAKHPVFVALRSTIDAFDIPATPFLDLLTAFQQDQTTTRYDTIEELLGYCRNSANPVGRLVLYLGRAHDERRGALSDAICTGLQLANFWQDVARDRRIDRVYLPQVEMRRHGVTDADLQQASAPAALRRLLAQEVARAEDYLRQGLPLVELMPRALAGDVWLFAQGGLKILERIRRLNFDVLKSRPKVTKLDQLRLLLGCLRRNWFGAGGGA